MEYHRDGLVKELVRHSVAQQRLRVVLLYERLLPELRTAFGEELCRAWVDREILAISAYQLTGEITGPSTRTFTIATPSLPTDKNCQAVQDPSGGVQRHPCGTNADRKPAT